jgi:putative endonuclease
VTEQHPRVAIGNRCGYRAVQRRATPCGDVTWAPAFAGVTFVAWIPFAMTVIPAEAGTQCTEQRENAINGGMPKQPCVYILASKRNGTIYIGVTSDLFGRVVIHKQDLIEGFTKRYDVHQVVYYEMHLTMDAAIQREKRLKKWNRAWKIRLIESMNPEWIDLFDEFWGAINEGPADIARQGIGRPVVER